MLESSSHLETQKQFIEVFSQGIILIILFTGRFHSENNVFIPMLYIRFAILTNTLQSVHIYLSMHGMNRLL